MARTQARILVSIWSDADFLNLDPGPQRTYLFLLSQPNLSHAGLLPLTIKRWARSSRGINADTVVNDLAALEQARFVVVDNDTEELLVRTLVRNDGVWKQPKVMLAMQADAAEIVSPLLRQTLGEELRRIDTGTLKEESRRDVDKVIADLLETLPDTLPDTPTQGYPIPLAEASGYPHTCAGAPSSASASTTATTSTTATGLATRDADREPTEDPTDTLLAEHVRAYAQPPPPSAIIPIKREIMRLVSEKVAPDRIRDGLTRLRERRLAASLLPQLVTEAGQTRRRSTSDDRADAGLALAEQLRAEGR